jgi:sugar phosphate isomerase/epimerase
MCGGKPSPEPFRYCLNTSTIKGQGLGIVEEAEVAAEAGYSGIEPWVRELDTYVEGGGSLKDLGERFSDLGLTVEGGIGFFDWVVDDDAQRAAGLEEARRAMGMLREIGALRVAAPPCGATDVEGMDLRRAAERYRDLLEIGDEFGVVPMVEVWGFSTCLGRLGEGVMVAIESGHPRACVLADVFHMYKGESNYEGLRLVGPGTIAIFHMNDFPADPARETIKDAERVWPGDGVAPLDFILGTLREVGWEGVLSLELFNPVYYELDALDAARTGLEKMRGAVRKALSGE